MKLSEFTLRHLAKVVCGDYVYMPYVRGFDLVLFFNKYGFNETYEQGFPSRWKYTEDKLRVLNGKETIRQIIEVSVDPRRFHGHENTVEIAVKEINEILKFDKYELRKVGDFYKLSDLTGFLVVPTTANAISHDFVIEQIDKCHKKILENDFDGAITNSRSLIEAIFIEIIERHKQKHILNDGSIENQWKQVKKIMKLEIDNSTLPDYVIQILSGIDTAVKGLAGLSNNAGDRHAIKFKTKKHHAKLAVNLSMTVADFLLESWNYQSEKKSSSLESM